MSKRMISNGMLLLAAMIWGAAFVAQTVGMEYVEPFTFQACRCFLGSLVLIPVILLMDRRGNDKKPTTKAQWCYLLLSGALCGTFLFAACSLQQLGLLSISAGKSGFITSLYIILVPIFGLFLGKKVQPWIWGSVVLAIVGLYLLCGSSSFAFGKGELLTLGCAVAFSFQIILVGSVSPKVDGVRLSCIQFFVCGLLSIPFMLLFEEPKLDTIVQCWIPIGYAGVFSCGVAYTLQIIGQARTDTTVASLLMSPEAAFAALFGWLLLGQSMNLTELLGCILVFVGIILAQLPGKQKIVS